MCVCVMVLQWMKSLNKNGKASEAMAVFDRMLGNQYVRLQPDTAVFASVLHACELLRDYDRAKLYWRALQMNQGKRRGVEPNVQCYNALIRCTIAACARTDALHLLDQMRRRGVRPNSDTYAALMLSCAASGSPHTAFTVRPTVLARVCACVCVDGSGASGLSRGRVCARVSSPPLAGVARVCVCVDDSRYGCACAVV